MRLSGFAALALTLALAAPTAWAQNVYLDAPGLLPKKPPPRPTAPAAPLAWPRLDPGATLCDSEGGLDGLAAYRARGDRATPAGCHRIAFPTAIEIIRREGPGRTQVRLSGSPTGETGWTDAWLPNKAPTSATSATFPLR